MQSSPPSSASSPRAIGVFDSGVGGLSVLRALRRELPQIPLRYVADSGHAPYGERSTEFIVERSRRLTEHLLGTGAEAIVIACNTATAAAAELLRQQYPGVRFIGVEPGLKPAIACSRNRRIGVMATQHTLASAKFRLLVARHAQDIALHLQACPGLARAIEAGDADSAKLQALVDCYAGPLREAGVDTVVLGCTHYPFAAAVIQAALGPQVTLIDTADAVARHARTLLAPHVDGSPTHGSMGPVTLWSSGEVDPLQRVARLWLGLHDAEVRPLPDGV